MIARESGKAHAVNYIIKLIRNLFAVPYARADILAALPRIIIAPTMALITDRNLFPTDRFRAITTEENAGRIDASVAGCRMIIPRPFPPSLFMNRFPPCFFHFVDILSFHLLIRIFVGTKVAMSSENPRARIAMLGQAAGVNICVAIPIPTT